MPQYDERLAELRQLMSGKNRPEQLINKLKKQRQSRRSIRFGTNHV